MMTSTMEQSPYTTTTTSSSSYHNHHQRDDESDFSLREWAVKSRIRRENTSSRRFSESYIRSFREDPTRSFRSSITISRTASSPAYYPFKDEIDPSTYSFSTALKALQARAGYNSWDFLSPEGFSLNAKWSEAEKYISNPLSGEVPMECLSAKTLSGRSFFNSTNRVTMSAPLIYTTQSRKPQTKPTVITIPEKKLEGLTRDVGIQSTPSEPSSSSPSPNSMPVIIEKSIKICSLEGENVLKSKAAMKDEKEVTIKESQEKEQTEVDKEEAGETEQAGGGCLSWMRKRQRKKHKPRRKKFLAHLKSC